jgi:hypothetical protein
MPTSKLMPLLHVLLLPLLPNAAAAIFNCRPMLHPNNKALPPSSNAISSYVGCCVLTFLF